MNDLLLVLGMALTASLQQPAETTAQEVEIRARFEQTLSARDAGDTAQSLKVSLRDQTIRGNQKTSLTDTGTLVIQVRAGGPVVTIASGQRIERKEGEFFLVPAGTPLSIETGNDTVVLTILEVQR